MKAVQFQPGPRIALWALVIGLGSCRSGPMETRIAYEAARPPLIYVWWEAEDAREHNFNFGGLAPETLDHPHLLSDERWLYHTERTSATELFASWQVDVPETGAYQLYARTHGTAGPLRWRFGDGRWREAQAPATLDSVPLGEGVSADWVSLGEVDLEAGEQRFELRVAPAAGPRRTADKPPGTALDCFVLSRRVFVPAGARRPGRDTGRQRDGYWAFEPDADPDPPADSPVDLSFLNDHLPGERGYIRAEGRRLVYGDTGEPVRFFGVVVGDNMLRLDAMTARWFARRLRRRGVNLVRVPAGATDPGSTGRSLEASLAGLHRFAAALKAEGIYLQLGIPGAEATMLPEARREAFRAWLTAENPNTDLSLAEDPVLAILEIPAPNADARTVRWLREALDLRCVVIPQRSHDPAGEADPQNALAGDASNHHVFWGPIVQAEAGPVPTVGQRYADRCAMFEPETLPLALIHPEESPSVVSAFAWTRPNRFRTDAVWLGGAYGALQGLDAMCFFRIAHPGWDQTPGRSPAAVPSVYGQFPAAALIFRRGDVAEGPVVLSATAADEVDPLSCFAGRVVQGADDARTADLSPWIDRETRTIRSATGEIVWNYGAGYATLNSPRAQGVWGMLRAAGEVSLDAVSIGGRCEYGAVMLVSLDGEPLEESKRVLLQAMTEETPFGYESRQIETEDGRTLRECVSTGTPPLNVREAAGLVGFRCENPAQWEVSVLDANGYPANRPLKMMATDQTLTIQLAPDVLYYVLQERPR